MKIIKGLLIGIGIYSLIMIPTYFDVKYPPLLIFFIGVISGFVGQILIQKD